MKIPQILGGNAFDLAFHGALEYQHIINHTTDESAADTILFNHLLIPGSGKFNTVETSAYFIDKQQSVFGGHTVDSEKSRKD